MEGKRILYNRVVANSTKGERAGLKSNLARRDSALAARYHYHAVLCRLRYDDALLALSKEFYMEPETIVKRLKVQSAAIYRMAKENCTAAKLREQWPHYDWARRYDPTLP